MQLKGLALCMIVILFVSVTVVSAEEKFGVKVYDGAKFDSTVTNFLKQLSPEAAGYRTNNSVAKVVEFYMEQPGLKFMGGNDESALLRKDNVDVTVQSPWLDMQTGKMMKDTLISIVKQKE
jgi:hypothetical protein